jgi:hypothetical protein
MKTNLKTADKIILFIPKKIIEANDYSFVLKIFDDVLKDPALIRKFKNQVTIGFDGYDDEPKEVFEINEVRNYIQHLTTKFPYWFYFLSLDDHSLWMTMLILCKFEKVHGGWQARISRREMNVVLTYLHKHWFEFYEKYGLPKREMTPQAKKINKYMEEFKL